MLGIVACMLGALSALTHKLLYRAMSLQVNELGDTGVWNGELYLYIVFLTAVVVLGVTLAALVEFERSEVRKKLRKEAIGGL